MRLWHRAQTCVETAKTLLVDTDSSDARWVETNWHLRSIEGWLAHTRGDLTQGTALLRTLLDDLSTGGIRVWPYSDDSVRFWRATVCVSLGYKFLAAGHSAKTQAWAKEALALATQIGSESLTAGAAGLLAMALHHDGDYQQAEKWGLTCLELLHSGGDQADFGFALSFLGALYQYWGKHDRARVYLLRNLASARAAGMYEDITISLLGLGNVALDLGELRQARQLYQETLTRCRQSETAGMTPFANSLVGLGWVALVEGDLAAARQHFWQVLSETTPTLRVIAKAIAGAAHVLQGEGELVRAVELCAFLLEWPATEYATKQKVGELLDGLESRLAPELFAAAIVRGRDRQVDEVVAELVGG